MKGTNLAAGAEEEHVHKYSMPFDDIIPGVKQMLRPNSSGRDSFRLCMVVEAGEDIQVIKLMKGSFVSKI